MDFKKQYHYRYDLEREGRRDGITEDDFKRRAKTIFRSKDCN